MERMRLKNDKIREQVRLATTRIRMICPPTNDVVLQRDRVAADEEEFYSKIKGDREAQIKAREELRAREETQRHVQASIDQARCAPSCTDAFLRTDYIRADCYCTPLIQGGKRQA